MRSQKIPKAVSLRSFCGASLMPWPHPESSMQFPDRKECHFLMLSIPDLILGFILDLPECAEQCSRCSLSLVFTFWACFEIAQTWSPKWTLLRLKKSLLDLTWVLPGPLGVVIFVFQLKLNKCVENVSDWVSFWWSGGRVPDRRSTMVSPSNLHRISIESPWNLHRRASISQRRGPLLEY